jgi:Tol biopolymer transport system component
VAALATVVALSFRSSNDRAVFGRQWQLTRDPGLEIEAAISPDGKFVAYVVDDEGATRIMVRQVEGGEPVVIDAARNNFQTAPQWSPDGNHILFLSGRGIEVIPPLGGQSRLIIRAIPRTVLSLGSYSPEGDEFAYSRGDTLFIANLEGVSRTVTIDLEPHSFAWSPDGRLIAYVSGNRESKTPGIQYGNTASSVLRMVSAQGGTARTVAEGGANLSPAWLGDRTLLYISNRDGSKDVYSTQVDRSGQATGEASRLTTGLNATVVSVSADGTRAVYTVFREQSNIWSMPNSSRPLAISEASPITTGSQIIERFSVSPDGSLIVYDSDRDGLSDIYMLHRASGDVEPLTPDSVVEFAPRWSEDGREIAYHAIIEGRRQIFVMGSDKRTAQVTRNLQDNRVPRWNATGNRIYLSVNTPSGGYAGYVERRPDSTWAPVVRLPVAGSSPSPDDRYVVSAGRFVDMQGKVVREYFFPQGVTRLRESSWLGSRFYFVGADASDIAKGIWSVSPVGGAVQLHVRFDDATRPWHRYGLQALADRLYFTLGERESDIWAAELHEK